MTPAAKNIWYVAHYAGGPDIGRHSRGWYLARTWAEAGIRSTVILANHHHMLDGDQPAGARQVRGVDYHFLPTPAYRTNGLMRVINMFAFTAAFRARQADLIRLHGRPDAIIASSPHPFAFLATHRLARSLGARSIFEVRDLWPASITEIMKVSPRHPLVMLTAAVERHAYAKADAVVSLLPGTEDYMRARGLSGNRWHYIPNGIVRDEKTERPAASPIFDEIEAWQAQGHVVVVYAGALGVPNNVDRLLDAAALLAARKAPVRIAIIGRGDLEDELQAQVARLGLAEMVRFFGQVPRGVARAAQECADIGFIALKPSTVFRFGVSPNKIFDYMMAGLPVVAAIDAGNDIVADANCGISVREEGAEPIAAALSTLVAMTRDQRRALGESGRNYVKLHHDYASLAQSYVEIIS